MNGNALLVDKSIGPEGPAHVTQNTSSDSHVLVSDFPRVDLVQDISSNPNLNDGYRAINCFTCPLDLIEWKPERYKLFVSVSWGPSISCLLTLNGCGTVRVLYTVNSNPQYILAKSSSQVPAITCTEATAQYAMNEPVYARTPLKACLAVVCDSR